MVLVVAGRFRWSISLVDFNIEEAGDPQFADVGR